MTLFKNKYRIESFRLKNWDYRNAGAYFITICTKNRENYFGKIVDAPIHNVESQCIASLQQPHPQQPNNIMQSSQIGKIIENEWIKTPEIRPDMNLELGEFVVMPNHFHAILMIGQNEYNIQLGHGEFNNKFGPQSKNVSSILRGFKSAVTTASRLIDPDFGWQSKFHDHIIRNHEEYQRIENYIINNPKNWDEDKFYNP